MMRKRLLECAKGLRDGVEPTEVRSPDAYRVRSIETLLPRDVDLFEGARGWTGLAEGAMSLR